MAKHTIVRVSDDFDGSDAANSFEFEFDGTAYEIDLNDAHAAEFRDAFAPYISAGRRVPVSKSRSRGRGSAAASRNGAASPAQAGTSAARTEELTAIRAWAATHGYAVADRGRIAASVVEAYRADQQSSNATPASPAKKTAPKKTVAKKAAKKAPAKKVAKKAARKPAPIKAVAAEAGTSPDGLSVESDPAGITT